MGQSFKSEAHEWENSGAQGNKSASKIKKANKGKEGNEDCKLIHLSNIFLYSQ